ncbi:hypothetical protein KC19_N040600 [Ceratodon purpureus]|nr:hypothetical protein KC19_N040600 [Ceratodon purpureus]
MPKMVLLTTKPESWSFTSEDDHPRPESGSVSHRLVFDDLPSAQVIDAPSVDEQRTKYRIGVMKVREQRRQGISNSEKVKSLGSSRASSISSVARCPYAHVLEVSWLSVGKDQLEFAARALRRVSSISGIWHSRSEAKFFSLLQKAAYTVGGHSFNAATIEFCLLRSKSTAHRPQLSHLMSQHKISSLRTKASLESTTRSRLSASVCAALDLHPWYV